MGAAAAKTEAKRDGTMEDILSSIRKIISADSAIENEDATSAKSKPVSATQEAEQVTPNTEIKKTQSDVAADSAFKSAAELSRPPSGSLAAVAASVAAGDIAPTPAPEASKPAPSEPVTTEDTGKAPIKSLAQTVREMSEQNAVREAAAKPYAKVEEKPAKAEIVAEEPKARQKPTLEEKAFKEALVSPSTQEAVSSSMDRLKKSVSDVDAAQVEAALRPMLREWLDDNLPALVEKMVREEIDRIASASDANAAE